MGKQYSCNPKYLCRYIEEHDKSFQIIWVYYKNRLPCTYEQVKRNSIPYFYHMLTAGTVIINSGKNNLLRLRKEQIQINTWHGGGAYKRLDSNLLHEKYRPNDYYLSSCRKATENVIRIGLKFNGQVIESGFPRNDILFAPNDQHMDRIKKFLGIGDKKCVLYAPTFRNDLNKTEFGLDYRRLIRVLGQKFGGEWIVLKRGHYHTNTEGENEENVVNVSDYPDMQELLLISDVLLTDYSSSIWDYSILKRPAFLYTPDLDDYYEERDFYIDIHKWPFAICRTNDELETEIWNYEHQECIRKIENHHEFMESYEAGTACRNIYQFIEKKQN